MNNYNHRNFIKNAAIASLGLGFGFDFVSATTNTKKNIIKANRKRIGLIGLDTGHCVAFTKAINDPLAGDKYGEYRVVAAYPNGTDNILEWKRRIPEFTLEIKSQGVEIVNSIDQLLKKVDVVILTCIDGNKHLEQALPVLKAGKSLFIDKPVSASLSDTILIFEAAKHYNTPVFSSSSLRFMSSAKQVADGKFGRVLGADTYSPCILEKTHPDFFWYGIHGVEILYTVMGTGCKQLVRFHTEGTDMAVGSWEDGRIGTFRGTRTGKHTYGGTAFGENGDAVLGPAEGYEPLLSEIVKFFDTKNSPVKEEVTQEICAFMEAADKSKLLGEKPVDMTEIWEQGRSKAHKKLKFIL